MGAAKASPNRHDITEKTASALNARQRHAARERENTPKRKANLVAFTIHPEAGDPFLITVNGRIRWALERLLGAGTNGCTPLLEPAPRWSHYIHQLRGMGVEIETIHEPHGGSYPGHHGRYVLRCQVVPEGGAT
jgi:hypothetical protein